MLLLVLLAVVLSVAMGRMVDTSSLNAADSTPRSLKTTAWCESPIKKAPVNFPESLVGRADVTFDMFSGYVNVTKNDFLYYWLTMAADNNPDAPLIVWTNGGPGCTAMEGATTENGPLTLFYTKESCTEGTGITGQQCDYTNQFSSNKYSWNRHANVVYLDQPRFVGNSGGPEGATAIHSSVDAAQDFITFYKGFLELFPEFQGRDLIISGESYGGHYIPAFAQAILDENAKQGGEKIPFAGAVIGNGCTDDSIQNTETYVEFLQSAKLLPAGSAPKTTATANSARDSFIGYTPNYYDYRLQSISCAGCYGYNYNDWSHFFVQDEVKAAMNVCGDAGNDAFAGTAGGCIDSIFPFDAKDNFDYVGALANTLNAGVPITFYYGKQDTACNYVGGMALANAIPYAQQADFNKADMTPLEIAGAEVGQIKTAGGLVFMQVDMAGHMVGLDEGAASMAALETLVRKYRK